MTKQNPDRLCKECSKFDYDMNRRGGISMDMFVVCECDKPEATLEEILELQEAENEKGLHIESQVHL
jgi:hypothetical protein